MIQLKQCQPDLQQTLKQQVRLYAMGGSVFDVSQGMAGVLQRLRAGRAVGIASDVPRTSPIKILGRDLLATSGAAHAAFASKAPVVVMTSRRAEALRAVVHLSPPLEPGDFADVQELLRAMLSRHESAVRAWPEAFDNPLNRFRRTDPADVAFFGEGPAL